MQPDIAAKYRFLQRHSNFTTATIAVPASGNGPIAPPTLTIPLVAGQAVRIRRVTALGFVSNADNNQFQSLRAGLIVSLANGAVVAESLFVDSSQYQLRTTAAAVFDFMATSLPPYGADDIWIEYTDYSEQGSPLGNISIYAPFTVRNADAGAPHSLTMNLQALYEFWRLKDK